MFTTFYLGNDDISFPEWLIFHIPHDSQHIPKWCRDQFVIDDNAMQRELYNMTDLYTHEIFAENIIADNVIHAKYSRLIVDVERFAFALEETMSNQGQGVIYNHGFMRTVLRRDLSLSERRYLLEQIYYPHHEKLNEAEDDLYVDTGVP